MTTEFWLVCPLVAYSGFVSRRFIQGKYLIITVKQRLPTPHFNFRGRPSLETSNVPSNQYPSYHLFKIMDLSRPPSTYLLTSSFVFVVCVMINLLLCCVRVLDVQRFVIIHCVLPGFHERKIYKLKVSNLAADVDIRIL